MFEGDDNNWWVGGGGILKTSYRSSEVFNTDSNNFTYGIALPGRKTSVNLVNVNNTHMVMLKSNKAFITDRYVNSILYINLDELLNVR